MHRIQTLLITALALLTTAAHAQLPANFTWINIESDQKVMPQVRRALHDPTITAIREVGVEDGYALVMTASREADAPTPDYDGWTIYNVALNSGKSRVLANGYGVKILDWIPPTSGGELAITYYDCWECEADTLFTTLHFVKGVGWRARWPNKSNETNSVKPGAVLLYADDGDINEEDQQVYAIVKQPNDGFAVGNWMHSRNERGKFDDDVERYTIDPSTGVEKAELLKGSAAEAWKREICTQSNILIQPSSGQDSKACKAILKPAPPHPTK